MRKVTKKFMALVWIVVVLLVILSSYVLYIKLTTPPTLPLKNIKPGESLNLEYVNQFGGAVSSGQIKPIFVNDNLVYVGIGPRLAILDISDLSNIYLVGQSEIILDLIGEIVLVGNYIYIAPGGYGDDMGANQKLHIVDVSDPTQPQYVGAYSPQDRYVSSVYVFDEYLYITAKEVNSGFTSPDEDLYILDISNPVQPKEISHYIFDAGISDMAVSGSYVYVAMYKPGLRILDVSDLQKPKETNFSYPLKSGSSLSISGNYLYLSGSTEEITWGFHIFDISNPREPRGVATRDGDAVELVSVYQNTAYFWSLGSQSSLSFVDVSDPQKPRGIGEQNFNGRVVSVQKDVVFVMDDNKLTLFDLSSPLKPVELGFYTTLIPDNLLPELYFNGTKGIVPVNTDMYFLDFSNPVSPIITSLYNLPDLNSIEGIQGNLVYIYTYPSQYYEALDFSDPTKPSLVWRHEAWDDNNYPFKLVITEKYLYLINPVNGFYVYDNSDPANPELISHQSDLKGFDGFDDFAVSGNYIYILNGRDIHILNASNPTAIAEVSIFKFPSRNASR